ncbi:MAG: hypothetical protein IPJ84_13870 [Bdellovibrionales bacterium]|nr:hypothetical protein [Bdellovibrionales bacterium]
MSHGVSFKLISHFDSVIPGELAAVRLQPTGREFYFVDHFPGRPLVPGVIQIEWLAQLATLCLKAKTPDLFPVLLSVRRSQFLRPIRPGDECSLEIKRINESDLISTFHGRIQIGEELVSEVDFLVRNWTKSEFDIAMKESPQ